MYSYRNYDLCLGNNNIFSLNFLYEYDNVVYNIPVYHINTDLVSTF